MKKENGKKFICFLFALILMISGCGKQDGAKNGGGRDYNEGGGQPMIMGRYVEKETDLSGQIEKAAGLYGISDGKLVLVGSEGELLLSEDNGNTWENSSRQWIQELPADSWLMDVKIDSKGTIGIIYAENDMEKRETQEPIMQSSLKCVLILPDDTVIPVDFSGIEKEETIDRFWVSNTDRYFVSTNEGTIYEVNADGSSELFLTIEGFPQIIQFQGTLMIIDGYDFKAPLLYDMERKEYVSDAVLTEFVQENYADRGFHGAGWQNMYFFTGEDDVIYLAGKKGLHRHVIGGAAMEQIIDGRLSRLGNPQYGIVGMVFLDKGEFLAASNNGKLINFTYDPNKEAVPRERLKIYSLEKNVDMYAAVSFYQIQNPDVLVEYEVGMEEDGAGTKEDAVKKLNTQIMAGEGPDILMLDGLPVDSYIEKGILCELNSLTDSLGNEAFENLFRAYEKDDRIYAIPGQIRFPVIMGKKCYVSGMTGLGEIADEIERMRKENPEKDLTGLCSEKAVMKLSAREWKKEDGKLDREAIAEFLAQTKRIYHAQMDGIEEKSAERLYQSNHYYTEYAGQDWIYQLGNYGFYMDYVAGYCNTFFGVSYSPQSYIELTSISKAEGFGDAALISLESKEGRVFIPETILGINAVSQKKELAEDFLKMFLSKDNQCRLSGFAVNRAAFDEAIAEKRQENEECTKVGMIYEDGRELLLDIYMPVSEEIAAIREWMETAKTPYTEDIVFEKCVFEEGSEFVLGERGIEETLDAIERRLAIYIAE